MLYNDYAQNIKKSYLFIPKRRRHRCRVWCGGVSLYAQDVLYNKSWTTTVFVVVGRACKKEEPAAAPAAPASARHGLALDAKRVRQRRCVIKNI